MFIIWTLLKSFFVRLIPFLLQFWRELIIVVMLCLWLHEKSSHNAIVQELAVFKQDIANKTAQQVFVNSVKDQLAVKQIAKSNQTHIEQLNQIKDDYEKRTKSNVGTIADLRQQLRDSLTADGTTMPKITADTYINPTSESKCDGAYTTLLDACKITTSDFNALRSWADSACEQFGCE